MRDQDRTIPLRPVAPAPPCRVCGGVLAGHTCCPSEFAPGAVLAPAVTISPAELVALHPAEIARRLGLHRTADFIETAETEALLEGGEWEFE